MYIVFSITTVINYNQSKYVSWREGLSCVCEVLKSLFNQWSCLLNFEGITFKYKMSIFKACLVTSCFLYYVFSVEIEVLLWNVEYLMLSEQLWLPMNSWETYCSGETKGRYRGGSFSYKGIYLAAVEKVCSDFCISVAFQEVPAIRRIRHFSTYLH